jgi:hypothetical protein
MVAEFSKFYFSVFIIDLHQKILLNLRGVCQSNSDDKKAPTGGTPLVVYYGVSNDSDVSLC